MNIEPDYEKKDDHLARRILERIRGERIIPRWKFIFKNYFFWALGALATALGALAFSAALFEVQSVDWRFSSVTHTDFWAFFFAVMPFLWVGALALFIVVGYVNIRRTKHGYRYPLLAITLGAICISLALGTGLYATGLGREIEESIGDHPPFYRPIVIEERSWWLAPEKGLLGGRVVSSAPDSASFVLRDFDDHIWSVEENDLDNTSLAAVARGGVVRVIGVPTTATSSSFHACFVFSWEPRGGFFGEPAVPPAKVITASTSERSAAMPRSEVCRGIRPYQQLRHIDETGL
ncbi:hypothetical protein KGQ25_00705 [Patescibacteria group bacterium]|nr:hypothetical protein [Patescibacteria group bacterium]